MTTTESIFIEWTAKGRVSLDLLLFSFFLSLPAFPVQYMSLLGLNPKEIQLVSSTFNILRLLVPSFSQSKYTQTDNADPYVLCAMCVMCTCVQSNEMKIVESTTTLEKTEWGKYTSKREGVYG